MNTQAEQPITNADSAEFESDLEGGIEESDSLDVESEDITSDEESTEPEIEFEEVDYEGKKYSVPKDLKDAILRQADYTRKTQEIAETRRALQAQAAEMQERQMFSDAVQQDMAQIASIDQTLNQYQQVDWNKLAADDPGEAQRHWIAYQQAKEQREHLAGQIGAKLQMLMQRTKELRNQQLSVGIGELSKEIPNFMEVRKDLMKAGSEHYGFDPMELQTIVDPRMVRVLHDAYLYRKGQAAKGGQKPPAVAQQPATTVRSSSGSAKYDLVRDADKMSSDEWLKKRNAELKKRGHK